MAKDLLDELKLKAGRLLGFGKRKKKDIVDMWLDLCRANGQQPAERLIQLLAFDLHNNGVDVEVIGEKIKITEITKARAQFDVAQQVQNMIDQITQQFLAEKAQSTQTMMELQNQILELNQELSKQLAENAKLQHEIQAMKAILEKEKKKK